ncbi:relaxase/mobilization nuclease domain-containing protein [Haloarcula amylovorans]|uniref:relaxase/mobilization nuclease domain-containing protein n=1 Tax=Haloarcula amylovorans TaxID=2562280 RepID=UPI001075DB09|nr:relaxase/mobilization nuclease domain-containing protein [Halomicroarcula amylolytica]
MILKTDFQRSGAGKLLKYIRRDREQDASRTKVPLRDRIGRELDEERIEQFIEKSEKFGFQRHLIISPDPDADFTAEEISAKTRKFMYQGFGDQPTTDYAYAVHTDTEIPHSHVAATGHEPELKMDVDDIKRLRDRAKESFDEPERLKEKGADKHAEQAAESPDDDPEQTRPQKEKLVEAAQIESGPERDFDAGGY